MNEEVTNPPAPGLTLGDIYYVVFRHKWKILIISALGLMTAAVLPYVVPRPYKSEAKIMIRYVVENKSPGQGAAAESRVKSPDEGGASIVNSEIQILTSLDLAQQVADIVGPEKILPKQEGAADRSAAAAMIRGNLKITVPGKSSVIEIIFQHPDPKIVQPVLDELVASYFKRHAEIHRPVIDNFWTQETDNLRSRLVQTENALRSAKTNAGIVSLEDAKKSHSEQLSKIRLEIFAAEAELAQRQAVLAEISRFAKAQATPAANEVAKTNAVPSDKLAEYKRISSLLESFIKREQELSLQFTSENSQVKSIRDRIAAMEISKGNLEKEHPDLVGVVADSKLMDLTSGTHLDLKAERAKISALSSKILVLTNQLAQVRREATALESIESSITELQRKKELEEGNYKYFSANLEQSRIDEALGAARNSNISKIQAPSPPFRDSKKLFKMMAGAAFGGIGAALALAFFIELYLDRTIRRPIHIVSQLRAPLFLSIPLLSLNGKSRATRKVPLLSAKSNTQPSENKNGEESLEKAVGGALPSTLRNGHSGSPEVSDALRPFYETLRDRLIVYFEVNNLTHKPKLVAVTSCGEGSGVTTTAAGLAASLSETGEGNVLLVDMSAQQAEAHHFYKGRLGCGLEDVLEGGNRDNAMVQENLYVVSESTKNDKLPQVLPKRFKHLIPRLRASDYDYIIFDMPPVSQISPTPRLAQFMDMVFLVVESEKTNRDVVKNAADLLAESQANVGVILNKNKAYLPRRFQQDL